MYLKPGDTDSPLDQLLAEICRRNWAIVVSKGMYTKHYEASVTRSKGGTVSGGTGDTPSKAMMAAARTAIDKEDARIEKLRNS